MAKTPDHFSDFLNEEDENLDDGLDLEKLSQQYDQEVAAEDPFHQRPGSEGFSGDLEEEEFFDVNPTSILEAMLFVGASDNRSLSAQEMSALMRGVSKDDIVQLVDELNSNYQQEGAPFHIASDSNGFHMELTPEFDFCRDRFYREQKAVRLSQPVIDVLSLVAYLQPVTKASLEEKRLKPCSSILNQLVRRQLVRVERTKEKGKKAKTFYHTTKRFLEVFGLSSLDELPKSQMFEST